jgi:hypothetical protein
MKFKHERVQNILNTNDILTTKEAVAMPDST